MNKSSSLPAAPVVLTLLAALTSLVIFSPRHARAQQTSAETASAPRAAIKYLKGLLDEAGIETVMREMNENNQTEKRLALEVTASGAFLRRDLRDSNAILLPFTITRSANGQNYLALSLVSLTPHDRNQEGLALNSFLKFVPQFDLAVFKYDDGISFDRVKETSFSFVDANIELRSGSTPKKYLAVVLGVETTPSSSVLLQNDERLRLRTSVSDRFCKGCSPLGGSETRTGFAYHLESDKNLIHATATLQHRESQYYDIWEQRVSEHDAYSKRYYEDFEKYKIANHSPSLSAQSYAEIIGLSQPVTDGLTEIVKRNTLYFTPTAEYARKVRTLGKHENFVGVKIGAILPLRKDEFTADTGFQYDLHGNRKLVRAQLFVKF